MMNQKKFYLTKDGLEKIKKEYDKLKNLRLMKIKNEAPRTWQSEDLNPEYLAFQEDLSFFESRIYELEHVLKNVELIKTPPKATQDAVQLGATVTLEEEGGRVNEFVIVGMLEASPGEGKISSDSPVGKALINKKKGEEVVITSPIRVVYRIKNIKYHLS
ncbi:MAG: Transcription elongation factor GreA [Parcubacteria group bacterium GW2011_GWA1_36_12]|nr:MAG: Transcription elongation factor GreA [Parcubacteria group bacterium GW2011_GWA1_36_12]